jgi:SAM-dependent methyltransferase
MNDQATGHLAVETYRRAAEVEGAIWNYKGLAIHAEPEIHERIGELAAGRLRPGAAVLDLASGSGAMCLRLKDLGFSPTGCDIVTENFRLHGKVGFLVINLNNPLPADMVEAFDCVVATEVIEHLENPRHLLRQCFRALRPGGVLFMSTPNVDSPFSKAMYVRTGDFRWFGDIDYKRYGHITPIPRFFLEKALDEAGFVDVRIESVAPLTFPRLSWWKMRLLAWFLMMLSVERPLEGDILIAEASRPSN